MNVSSAPLPYGPTKPHFLTISGRPTREVMDLVHPDLYSYERADKSWCYLQLVYPDLAVGDKFTRLFNITYSGIIVPIAQPHCTLEAIHSDPGNYYESEFHKENPQFKSLWGWRPLGLLEFANGFPKAISWDYAHTDRWQNASPFYLSSEATFQDMMANEPHDELKGDKNLEGVREYLEVLTQGADINTLKVSPLYLIERPSGYIDLGSRKFQVIEMPVEVWEQTVRDSAKLFNISDEQINRFLQLLKITLQGNISRAWNLSRESGSGPFYAVKHADFAFEVQGQFFTIHMLWYP